MHLFLWLQPDFSDDVIFRNNLKRSHPPPQLPPGHHLMCTVSESSRIFLFSILSSNLNNSTPFRTSSSNGKRCRNQRKIPYADIFIHYHSMVVNIPCQLNRHYSHLRDQPQYMCVMDSLQRVDGAVPHLCVWSWTDYGGESSWSTIIDFFLLPEYGFNVISCFTSDIIACPLWWTVPFNREPKQTFPSLNCFVRHSVIAGRQIINAWVISQYNLWKGSAGNTTWVRRDVWITILIINHADFQFLGTWLFVFIFFL